MNYNTIKTNEFYHNKLHENNFIFSKDKNKSQNSLFSSLINPKEKLHHLKYKYSILNKNKIINPHLVHKKVQLLKNKYMKNNSKEENKLQINSVIQYSINNNNMNNNKTKFILNNNNKKNMFRSTSLKLVKENNFKFNNLYNSFKNEKKLFFIEKNNKENDNMQSKNELNNMTPFHKINNKNDYHFKYLKNVKEDFINVHNKFKELLQNDAFNKKKKKKLNVIFPISKKIFLLSEMKKNIQNVNKYSFTYSAFSPKSTISRNSESSKKNIFGELFNESNKDTINNFEQEIRRPNLIRSFSKPKLNVPKFSNLFNMKN